MTSMILCLLLMTQTPSAPVTKSYTSTQGRFSVNMPAKPGDQKRKFTIPKGEQINLSVVGVKQRISSYTVATGELSSEPSDFEATLAVLRDDVLAQNKGQIGGDTPIELGSIAGREFDFEIPKQVVAGGATGKARVFVLGKRVYQVIAVQSAADAKSKSAEATAFLDSFRLKDEPATKVSIREVIKSEPGVFASKKWGFRVRHPAAPKLEEKKIPSGEPILVATFNEGTRVYGIVALQKQEQMDLGQILDTIQGIRASSIGKGKLLSSRDVKVGDVRGKEYTIQPEVSSYPAGTIKKIRAYGTGRYIYNVSYVDVAANGQVDRTDSFLESFELLNPEPPAPREIKLTTPAWKNVELPGAEWTISMPSNYQSKHGNIKTGSEGDEVDEFVGNHLGCSVLMRVFSSKNPLSLPPEMTLEKLAKQMAGTREVLNFKKETHADGDRFARSYYYEVKSKPELEPIIIRCKVFHTTYRTYVLTIATPSGFEYEPLVDAYFASLLPSKK